MDCSTQPYAAYSTSFRKLQQLAEAPRTSVLQDQRESYTFLMDKNTLVKLTLKLS